MRQQSWFSLNQEKLRLLRENNQLLEALKQSTAAMVPLVAFVNRVARIAKKHKPLSEAKVTNFDKWVKMHKFLQVYKSR